MEKCNLVFTLIEAGLELRKNSQSDIDPACFKNLVGSLRYLTYTRLDILYRIKLKSRSMKS